MLSRVCTSGVDGCDCSGDVDFSGVGDVCDFDEEGDGLVGLFVGDVEGFLNEGLVRLHG